ncbi:DUF6113 family protein [Kitasatospora sp. GP82]|uniref:DUF6113 family protein n=1 Tax=Kitasatospora sp. GP82 TaxID=3035089 RepID=UPI002474A723|nr:DUF6113 family protein [Kitasatospora sp. GP82]MDH6123229.1 tetrahydromethanopterin S-methyltransferase subunit C [Kitasatospora sp. GP82]
MSTPPKPRSLPARVLGSQAERLAEAQPPRAGRIVAYVLLFPLGILVSLCGCFVQALWPPFGMILSVLASLGVFYGGLRLTGTRLGAGVPLAGWFLMLLILMSPRPEGDFVLSADLTSYAYLFLGAVGGVICATLPTRSGFGFGAAGPGR